MDTQSPVISIGSLVEVILRDRAGKEERLRVVIVPSEAADFPYGYLGVNTPLAQALVGERVGAIIPYLKDDIYSIEVVSVIKSEIIPPMDAEKKRQASLKKAIREVQDTNAITFASSFSGKWGDYDPDSIQKDSKQEEND
jgi:Transcription elongation factor, GreA/GreB, C-term